MDEILAEDWARLSASLPVGYTDAHVHELFYLDGESRTVTKRRPGFLSMLADETYGKVYEQIRKTPRLQFVIVHGLLRTSKEDGRIMVQVLNHVVAWVNSSPTITHDRLVPPRRPPGWARP